MKNFSNKNSIKDHNFMIFELLISEICNLDCSYCYMRNYSKSWGTYYRKDKIKEIIDTIESLPYNSAICLSGGESSLHPNFLELIKYSSEKKLHGVHINTNFRFNKDTLEKILNINNNIVFHISFHGVETQTVDEYIEKLLMLKPDCLELNVMINPNKKYIQKTEEFINACIKNNIKFYLKPVYIHNKYKLTNVAFDIMEKYKDVTTKEYIDDTGKEYNDFDLKDMLPMNTYNWDCYYTFFTINCDKGNIKQMCQLFPKMNLFDDYDFFKNYKLDEPKKCQFINGCLWASALDHYKEAPNK